MENADSHVHNQKDPVLWEIAKKRYGFKVNLSSYIIINAFLWILYFLTRSPGENDILPWPVWPMFGWGIGVLFHYISAYVVVKNLSVEKEYDKLVNKSNKS